MINFEQFSTVTLLEYTTWEHHLMFSLPNCLCSSRKYYGDNIKERSTKNDLEEFKLFLEVINNAKNSSVYLLLFCKICLPLNLIHTSDLLQWVIIVIFRTSFPDEE